MTNPTILLKDNDRHRKYTGVDKFHRAGYYGERVRAASGETWPISKYNPGCKVFDHLGIGFGSDDHPINTAATFFQVAPKAELYMLYSTNGSYSGDDVNYTSKFFQYSTNIIEKYNITNMFVSLNTSRHKKFFADLKNWYIMHPEFKPFWCAGNDSDKKYNTIMEIDEVIGVAAYTLMMSGDVVPAYYSSLAKYVDFSAPSMIYLNPDATKADDTAYPNSGTSFATPWLCGMSCLVDDFFIDKTGKPLTREGMVQFFKDHCVDIGDKGFDKKTGFGAVVLPDPSEIDVQKYYKIGRKDEQTMGILDKFADKEEISTWAREGVEWAVKNGLINGISETQYAPKSDVTREQMAVIFHRFYTMLHK